MLLETLLGGPPLVAAAWARTPVTPGALLTTRKTVVLRLPSAISGSSRVFVAVWSESANGVAPLPVQVVAEIMGGRMSLALREVVPGQPSDSDWTEASTARWGSE